MDPSRPIWVRRPSDKPFFTKEVRQETSDNVAHQRDAVVSHLLSVEAARIYVLDAVPSRDVGGARMIFLEVQT